MLNFDLERAGVSNSVCNVTALFTSEWYLGVFDKKNRLINISKKSNILNIIKYKLVCRSRLEVANDKVLWKHIGQEFCVFHKGIVRARQTASYDVFFSHFVSCRNKRNVTGKFNIKLHRQTRTVRNNIMGYILFG